ncbi:MAG: hypothetical protein ACI8RA_001142 [Chlamydiales bacterium]
MIILIRGREITITKQRCYNMTSSSLNPAFNHFVYSTIAHSDTGKSRTAPWKGKTNKFLSLVENRILQLEENGLIPQRYALECLKSLLGRIESDISSRSGCGWKAGKRGTKLEKVQALIAKLSDDFKAPPIDSLEGFATCLPEGFDRSIDFAEAHKKIEAAKGKDKGQINRDSSGRGSFFFTNSAGQSEKLPNNPEEIKNFLIGKLEATLLGSNMPKDTKEKIVEDLMYASTQDPMNQLSLYTMPNGIGGGSDSTYYKINYLVDPKTEEGAYELSTTREGIFTTKSDIHAKKQDKKPVVFRAHGKAEITLDKEDPSSFETQMTVDLYNWVG